MITFSRRVEKPKEKEKKKKAKISGPNSTILVLSSAVSQKGQKLLWAFGSGNGFALVPEACGFSLASLESWPIGLSPSLVLIKLGDGFWITLIPRALLVSPQVGFVVHSRLQWMQGQRSWVTPTAEIRLSSTTRGTYYRVESSICPHRTKAIALQLFPVFIFDDSVTHYLLHWRQPRFLSNPDLHRK